MTSLTTLKHANTACSRLGTRRVILAFFAANASRWMALASVVWFVEAI